MKNEYEENKEWHNTTHTEPESDLGSMQALFHVSAYGCIE